MRHTVEASAAGLCSFYFCFSIARACVQLGWHPPFLDPSSPTTWSTPYSLRGLCACAKPIGPTTNPGKFPASAFCRGVGPKSSTPSRKRSKGLGDFLGFRLLEMLGFVLWDSVDHEGWQSATDCCMLGDAITKSDNEMIKKPLAGFAHPARVTTH